MRKLRRTGRGQKLKENALRSQYPFEVWAGLDELDEEERAALLNPRIGNADDLFAGIGKMMGTSGPNAQRWFKQYRKYTGVSRKRRKS